MTRREAEQYLKDLYQADPCGGGIWVETSDIEDVLYVAVTRGKAYLNDHIVTWSWPDGYKIDKEPRHANN
jgi:hypothetical protein